MAYSMRQGLSRDCLENVGIKRPEKTLSRIPTTNELRIDRVPITLGLRCAVSTYQKCLVETNCDVDKSPLRYACSGRNRVGEAIRRLPSQSRCPCIKYCLDDGKLTSKEAMSLCS